MNPFPTHPLPLYLVILSKETPFRGRTLEAGTPYVCDHVTLSLLSSYAVPASVATLHDTGGSDPVVAVMPGVHGDLMMLTAIKDEISVACLPEYASVLEGILPTYALPTPYDPSRHYVNLSHLTERPEVLGRRFTDGLRDMGFAVRDSLRYVVSEEERRFAETAWPKKRQAVRIAIQPYAAARLRTYPQMGELMTAIDHAFDPMPEVMMLCDHPLEIPESVRHRVLQSADFHCSVRQAAALIPQADILVCPDSLFQHIAGALGVPTVALFGPFHWSERVLSGKVRGLQGTAECGPCRHHAGSAQGVNYPDDPRCSVPKTGFCKAMGAITPERIVAEMKKLLKEAKP